MSVGTKKTTEEAALAASKLINMTAEAAGMLQPMPIDVAHVYKTVARKIVEICAYFAFFAVVYYCGTFVNEWLLGEGLEFIFVLPALLFIGLLVAIAVPMGEDGKPLTQEAERHVRAIIKVDLIFCFAIFLIAVSVLCLNAARYSSVVDFLPIGIMFSVSFIAWGLSTMILFELNNVLGVRKKEREEY